MCLSWWRQKPSFAHASAASVRGFVDPAVSSQPVDSDTRDGRHGSDHHPLGISYVIIGGNRALVVPRCEKYQCDSISLLLLDGHHLSSSPSLVAKLVTLRSHGAYRQAVLSSETVVVHREGNRVLAENPSLYALVERSLRNKHRRHFLRSRILPKACSPSCNRSRS